MEMLLNFCPNIIVHAALSSPQYVRDLSDGAESEWSGEKFGLYH